MSWPKTPRRIGLAAFIALCSISSCFMPTAWPAIAQSSPATVMHPLKSYAAEPDEASAYPYYDARAEIARYAVVAYESYQMADDAAHELEDAAAALVDDPTAASLAAARGAWLKARAAYMATEAFRFYGGPIDGPDNAIARIDPWPINEGFVDGVGGHPDGGLIGDPKIAITRQSLRQPPRAQGTGDVATGFHVIEFLLWGQDKNPGRRHGRHAEEFQAGGDHHADRRRLYLTTATKLLVEDLDQLALAWAPQKLGSYAQQFLALAPRDALGRMLSGIAILADQEIAGRRLLGALDDRTRASPLARYSLHTNDDLTSDLDGIRVVWSGDDRQSFGAGLDGLVQALDPALARLVDRRMAAAQTALRLIEKPFERALSASPGSPDWMHVERAAAAFHALALTLQDVGKLLAVQVPVSAS
jgi:putative iron-regulated protein